VVETTNRPQNPFFDQSLLLEKIILMFSWNSKICAPTLPYRQVLPGDSVFAM
jgi:hypothetical protein